MYHTIIHPLSTTPLTSFKTPSPEMTIKVTLDGQVLAESDKTVKVEGNHYFPPDSVKKAHFTDSDTQ